MIPEGRLRPGLLRTFDMKCKVISIAHIYKSPGWREIEALGSAIRTAAQRDVRARIDRVVARARAAAPTAPERERLERERRERKVVDDFIARRKRQIGPGQTSDERRARRLFELIAGR